MTGRNFNWPRLTRDGSLVVVGLGLTINEALFRHGQERPYLLGLYAGMMGLPVFLKQDEKKRDAVTPPTAPQLPKEKTQEELLKELLETLRQQQQPVPSPSAPTTQSPPQAPTQEEM